MENMLKLHLGCGPKLLLNGWLNIDEQEGQSILAMKLPKGLAQFESASAAFIYTSHFLEHISYPVEASIFVDECFRILAPGGVLRIIVPGIEKILNAYVRKDVGFFEIQATLHPKWCTTPLEHLMYALQQDGEHKYGYDLETMEKLLWSSGFRNISLSDFNKSSFEELRVDYRNVKDNHGNYLSLFVEAKKS